MSALRPGQNLDRFRLHRLLGAGGMAEVWEVSEPGRPGRLALKISRGGDATLARRLLREGRAAAALEHPNLLRVLDVVPLGRGAGLLMPLVRGPSLDLLLKRHQLAEAEALWLLREITRGVAHAHGLGMVHRDLKPGNVLLDLSGERVVPKVADFGLVKLEEPGGDRTRSGAVFGTPAYAAPEQLRDASRVDERADLWSLGVLLVELLRGRRPFAGAGLLELAEAHARGPDLEGLPPALAALAGRLLVIAPRDRLRSARALLDELDDLVNIDPPGPASALHAAAREAHARQLEQASAEPSEATWTALPEEAPPPRRLPAERDAFVGREAELRALDGLLEEGARLVSLVGLGGVGKTRLALRYAWTRLPRSAGGAIFCDLGEARDLDGVLRAMAGALELQLPPGEAAAVLGHALAARGPCLVVVDNFEQVARLGPDTLGRWLDAAPEARFLVTSREALGLPGERVLPVEPLPSAEAGALFLARGRDADPGFHPSEEDLRAIDSLVRLLDGLPLAVELAAARSRALPPRLLLERVSERFRLLSSPGGRPDRHATLRAALDWSWNLLSAEERSALAQLTVFEGGFSLEAAEAVLALEQGWPLDTLLALVDRSLARRVGEDRYDLLPTVAAWAAEKLPEATAGAARRHGAFYAALGARGAEARGGVELDNLVAACRRAVTRGEAETAVGALEGAWAALQLRGPYTGGPALAELVLRTPGLSGAARARALGVAGTALLRSGRHAEAEAQLLEAVEAARAAGDAGTEGVALRSLGILRAQQGRPDEARACYEAALVHHRAAGDARQEAITLDNLGTLHAQRGRLAEARPCHEAALALQRAAGDRRAEGATLANLGLLHALEGRTEEAVACLERSLALNRALGNRPFEAVVLGNLGVLQLGRGRLAEAGLALDEALALHRALGARSSEGRALAQRALLHREEGQPALASARFQEALALLRAIGDRAGEQAVRAAMGEAG